MPSERAMRAAQVGHDQGWLDYDHRCEMAEIIDRELAQLQEQLQRTERERDEARADNAALLHEIKTRLKHRCKEQIALDYAMKAQGHSEAIPHDTEHPGAALLERIATLERAFGERGDVECIQCHGTGKKSQWRVSGTMADPPMEAVECGCRKRLGISREGR